MARNLNIEILRLRKINHTATLLAVCALALAFLIGMLPGTQAQYATSDQDRHIFVFPEESKDVKVSLTEVWQVEDGINLIPGTTKVIKPIIMNDKDDCYMRVCLRIVDKDGNTIDPTVEAERANLILQTLWSDPRERIEVNRSYSLKQVKNLLGVNQSYNESKFDAPVWNSQMKAWCINHKDVFKKNETATVFDRLVMPTDYTNEQLRVIGDYYINIWAQAIQYDGFSSRDESLSKLSNVNVLNAVKS